MAPWRSRPTATGCTVSKLRIRDLKVSKTEVFDVEKELAGLAVKYNILTRRLRVGLDSLEESIRCSQAYRLFAECALRRMRPLIVIHTKKPKLSTARTVNTAIHKTWICQPPAWRWEEEAEPVTVTEPVYALDAHAT